MSFQICTEMELDFTVLCAWLFGTVLWTRHLFNLYFIPLYNFFIVYVHFTAPFFPQTPLQIRQKRNLLDMLTVLSLCNDVKLRSKCSQLGLPAALPLHRRTLFYAFKEGFLSKWQDTLLHKHPTHLPTLSLLLHFFWRNNEFLLIRIHYKNARLNHVHVSKKLCFWVLDWKVEKKKQKATKEESREIRYGLAGQLMSKSFLVYHHGSFRLSLAVRSDDKASAVLMGTFLQSLWWRSWPYCLEGISLFSGKWNFKVRLHQPNSYVIYRTYCTEVFFICLDSADTNETSENDSPLMYMKTIHSCLSFCSGSQLNFSCGLVWPG